MSKTCSSSWGSVNWAVCGHHERDLELVGLAERIVGIVNVVLRGDDVHPPRQQFLDAGNTAPLGLAIKPRRADEVDVGVDGNGDVRGREHIDYLRGIDLVISRHRPAMTGGHPAVKSLAHRLQGEVFEA